MILMGTDIIILTSLHVTFYSEPHIQQLGTIQTVVISKVSC